MFLKFIYTAREHTRIIMRATIPSQRFATSKYQNHYRCNPSSSSKSICSPCSSPLCTPFPFKLPCTFSSPAPTSISECPLCPRSMISALTISICSSCFAITSSFSLTTSAVHCPSSSLSPCNFNSSFDLLRCLIELSSFRISAYNDGVERCRTTFLYDDLQFMCDLVPTLTSPAKFEIPLRRLLLGRRSPLLFIGSRTPTSPSFQRDEICNRSNRK